ncbi:MAG TPA: nucleotide pyrophosphatase, partial [Acidimicrobiaceae bacterium]|nr:nucleotide pyrophosphatase [Acidimicrobiaceae bacterium]
MANHGSGRVLFIGLDACDAPTMLAMAAEGRLPALAGLVRDGAVVPTVAPYGTFVGSSWMTITTGRDVANHRFWNWLEIDPVTYQPALTTPREARGASFWQRVSDAGRRVAVMDVPHMNLPTEFNGVALKEWGCHDRHDGTDAYPRSLLDELDELVGRHPVGCRSHPRGDIAFAPCDYTERADRLRTHDEEARLAALLNDGVEAKRRAALHVYDKGPWDLFVTVMGEGHCVGHQLWHLHDPSHPRHDAAQRLRVGDPVADTYERIDSVIGDLVARAGDDTTVFVQMNHGMGPHFDGDHLFDELLLRI